MEGDPKFPGTQWLPELPLRRATRSSAGCKGIFCDDGDRMRSAWERGARRRPPRRARGQDRPRDPAAAAAHHGSSRRKKMAKAMVKGDPERIGVMAEVAARQARRSSPSTSGRSDVTAATGRAARGPRLHDPDRRAGVGRDARVGLDDDRRRRGRTPAGRPGSATRTATRPPPRCSSSTLAGVVEGEDAMDVARRVAARWARALRNAGRPGHRRHARSSAVDIALWDLKARLLEVCRSSTLLGAAHDDVPVYGSGGFCSYPLERLLRAARRLGRRRDPAREDEGRARARSATRRGSTPRARRSATTSSSTSTRTAPSRARRRWPGPSASPASWDVTWFEEPVSLATTSRGCASSATGRRPGSRSRPASTPTSRPTSGDARAAAVDCLQADVTRCGGITGLPAGVAASPTRTALDALRPLRARDLGARRSAPSRGCATSSTSTTTSASRRCSSTASSSPRAASCVPTARGPATGSSSSTATPLGSACSSRR